MSISTLTSSTTAPLADLVDVIAVRSGAWVIVERAGKVLAHGFSDTQCPPGLMESLLTRRTEPLRDATQWLRSARPMRGRSEGAAIEVWPLAKNTHAWFVGASPRPSDLTSLADVVALEREPDLPHDPVVEGLLHPRGMSRGKTPQVCLLVLTATEGVVALARATRAAATGQEIRLHLEDNLLFLSMALEIDPRPVLDLVKRSCPSAVAGMAIVRPDASDWAVAGYLARSALRGAQRLGTDLGNSGDPEIAAEMVVAEAASAVAGLVVHLARAPLAALRENDQRSSGQLLETLTVWCQTGFDVSATSAAVHIHPNTLRYRLKKAEVLSGFDFGRAEHLLALQLLLTD